MAYFEKKFSFAESHVTASHIFSSADVINPMLGLTYIIHGEIYSFIINVNARKLSVNLTENYNLLNFPTLMILVKILVEMSSPKGDPNKNPHTERYLSVFSVKILVWYFSQDKNFKQTSLPKCAPVRRLKK